MKDEVPTHEACDVEGDIVRPKKRSALRSWLQGIVGFLSAVFVVVAIMRDREALYQALELPITDGLIILGLLVGYFVLYAQRFVLLIEKHCRCRLGLLTWIRMLVVVRFMNNMAPQMGSIYRGVTLKRDYGVSYTDYISANLFFIWTDTLLNFIIAAALLWFLGTKLEFAGFPAATVLAGASVCILLAPLAAHIALTRIRHPSRILKKLSQVADELVRGLCDPLYMLSYNGIAIVSFLLMAGVFKILLEGIGAPVPLSTLAVFYALYRLTFHINLTPGNIGIREIAYGLLCSQAHIGMSKGLLIAAELRVLSIVVLVTVGAAVASRQLLSVWRGALERGPSRSA